MCLVNTAGFRTAFKLLKCLWLLLFNIQGLRGERERKAPQRESIWGLGSNPVWALVCICLQEV